MVLDVVDPIGHETVRKTLKSGMTMRKIEFWVIPPEQDAEFVTCREDVLETHAKASDSTQSAG